ncbi:MAG: cytochrome c-type biogenesis protein CcmH [Sphingomonas sp.]|nr:cytochrome c-type biogenesis protein CcmH [Sphingomonas sp.]
MRRLVILAAFLLAAPLQAQSDLPAAEWAYVQLPDPQMEADARELMLELRCLVCQGQSIADSDAEMAGDMRHLVRERMLAGDSPDEIRDYLVERYGEWVTYRPPASSLTLPLYAAPIILILAGLWLLRGRFTRRIKR